MRKLIKMKVALIKTVDITGKEVYLDGKSILYAVKSMGDDFKVHGKTIEEATGIIDTYEDMLIQAGKEMSDEVEGKRPPYGSKDEQKRMAKRNKKEKK